MGNNQAKEEEPAFGLYTKTKDENEKFNLSPIPLKKIDISAKVMDNSVKVT
jgi:hypothetical protein